MSFNGKLLEIKVGNSFVDVPLDGIEFASYKIYPNRRQDRDSVRDLTGYLHRTVVAHRPSTLEFNVRPMTNTEFTQFIGLFYNNFINEAERRVHLRFYVPDLDAYQEGDFYVPDIQPQINSIDGNTNTIRYASMRLGLVQY